MFELTAEEAFLWTCANKWRELTAAEIPANLNWDVVVKSAQHNRMQTLLAGVVERGGTAVVLPAEAATTLAEDAARMKRTADQLGTSLKQYLKLAAENHIETVALKGLSVSINVYGDAAMRPGGDIDLLVRPEQVEACLDILDGMGIGRYWPNLMDDAYYERHHLHQQRCSPDLQVWYEIHWALDHPLTTLTIDYDAMLDRATPGELMGEPILDLTPADLILSLAVHLVKHAVYLPATIDRPDLQRIILADGMLMYFLDVAEAIKQYESTIDWQQLVDISISGGAAEIMGSVLQVCARYLATPVPDRILQALPVAPVGATTRRIMGQVVDYEVATYMGEEPSKLWDLLLVTNGAFILRPIRALDLTGYMFPGRDYLQRKYGQAGFNTAVGHSFRAAGQYMRMGVDTIYFAWERYRRLKKMNQSASLFNRLEVDA